MVDTRIGSLLAVLLLASCTSMSGPTYNAYSVALPGGDMAYRVTCHGLLEGPGACRNAAKSICKGRPVTVLEAQSALGATSDGKPDDRAILFRCGEPAAAAAPVIPVPPPEPVAPPAPLAPTATILDGDASFDTDRATLKPGARAALDRLIGATGGMRVHTVTISGYTDSVGPDDYNVELSERRAMAVGAYLTENGLHAYKFVSRGFGKLDPVDTNETAAGRARNRRVEVRMDMN